MDLSRFLKEKEHNGSFLDLVEREFPGNICVDHGLVMIFNHDDFVHESGSIFSMSGDLLCPGRVVSDTNHVPENKDGLAIQIAEDGPYIRVWWNVSVWMISSQKRIKCHPGITEVICRILESNDLQSVFDKHLDKQFIYGFVVNSRDLSSVVRYPKEQLKLVSKVCTNTFQETLVWNNDGVLKEHVEPDLGIFPQFISYDQVRHFIENGVVESHVAHRGLVFHDYTVNRIFKYDLPEFTRLEKLAQVQHSELEYLFASSQERWYMMQERPEIDFVSIDKKISSLITNVINLYYDSIINKLIELPHDSPVLPLLKRLHMLYQREGMMPYPHIVEDCLRKSTVKFVKALIKWNNHLDATGQYVNY